MILLDVVLLTNAIVPDRIGGLERYVRELAGALADAGCRTTIVCRQVAPTHPASETAENGVHIRRFRTPSPSNPTYSFGYPLASAAAALRAANTAGPAIVHSHFPLQGVGVRLARSPFVHTFHAPVHRELLPEHRGRYLLPGPAKRAAVELVRGTERLVVRAASCLITLSSFMAEEARALGASSEALHLIPGGVDTVRFSPGEPIRHAWLDGRDGPTLFAARRLVPRTGVLELIRAMPAVVSRVPRARLAIAGRGPLDGAARELIAELGLDEVVTLLGWISDEELVGWYRAVDLVVLPTQELEGFGLATAEALACGTPVLGTPAGATPEILSAVSPDLITRSTAPGAISEGIIRLLDSPSALEGAAKRARPAIHPSMGWPAIAERHLEVYERHLARADA